MRHPDTSGEGIRRDLLTGPPVTLPVQAGAGVTTPDVTVIVLRMPPTAMTELNLPLPSLTINIVLYP